MKAKLIFCLTFFTAALLKDVRCQIPSLCIFENMGHVIFPPSFEKPPLCNDLESKFKLTRKLLKNCTRKEINIDEYEDLVKDYCDPESDVGISIAVYWKFYYNCGKIFDLTSPVTKAGSKITTTEVQKICESWQGLFATCLHNQFEPYGSSVQKITDRAFHAFKCVIIGQCYVSTAAEVRAIEDVRDDESITKVCTKRHPYISSGTIASASISCLWFITLGLLISLVFKHQI